MKRTPQQRKLLVKATRNWGKRIPCSSLYRDYCVGCGEPLRVTKEALDHHNECKRCDPHKPPPGVPCTTKGETSNRKDERHGFLQGMQMAKNV